jgi:general stress protein 26
MTEQIKKDINSLVENSEIAYVSSVDGNGYPWTKAMFSLQHDDLFTHYFSTNLFSTRTHQFLKNSKACVYFCDEKQFMGLMLIGDMQVMTDCEHKTMLWREGYEVYYPEGINTEDYCVYKFTAYKMNYYYGLTNHDFIREDFENAEI